MGGIDTLWKPSPVSLFHCIVNERTESTSHDPPMKEANRFMNGNHEY